jgi:c-di-GMP-binding flagellar brake protein YcgR
MSLDRRRAPRYQFIAHAEIVEIESGSKFKIQTGDLSAGGCFLDMMNPLSQEAIIQVAISHRDQRFVALARVVFVFPRLGMGVVFVDMALDQRIVLQDWLAELEHSRKASAAAMATAQHDSRAQISDTIYRH